MPSRKQRAANHADFSCPRPVRLYVNGVAAGRNNGDLMGNYRFFIIRVPDGQPVAGLPVVTILRIRRS